MIKKLLLIFFLVLCCWKVNAQQALSEQTRQISVQNGVVNYETAGVEGFVVAQEEPVVIVKPVSEWDLHQCEEMLIFINQKLQAAIESAEEESIAHYQQVKTVVLARKAVLTNQTLGE